MKHNFKMQYNCVEKIISEQLKQPFVTDFLRQLNISADELDKLLHEWGKLSLERLLQSTHTSFFKQLLNPQQASLFDLPEQKQYSTSVLARNVIILEQADSKFGLHQSGNLIYQTAPTPYGEAFVLGNGDALVKLVFTNDSALLLNDLRKQYPGISLAKGSSPQHEIALQYITNPLQMTEQIRLRLYASDFQIQVWQALLDIPFGSLSTYSEIAKKTGKANASRAVGAAAGSNPFAYLIPCHRLVKANGEISGYRWGIIRKIAMVARENAILRR